MLPHEAPAEPWRNGLGVTRTLCRGHGWRLSLADIEGAVPFSAFPGVDRILAVIGDQPLTLQLDGEARPLAPGEHVGFAGETPACATDVSRPARVLNLMTERAVARAVFDVTGRATGRWDLLLVLTGTARVGGVALPPGSAITSPDAAALLDSRGARLATVALLPPA
ncbi:HutD/Ves family protein [Microbacterium marinilacus]|uniref:HutD family protein n=1 Tax=Microbacterium marinilacus TaxID=415209 RepID=A0ABP7BSG5_9MICO|nr:HutD family protein [Microbacterium marinilacus]MBY0689108.1 HutD family protein [Microbacterium marinilacus]